MSSLFDSNPSERAIIKEIVDKIKKNIHKKSTVILPNLFYSRFFMKVNGKFVRLAKPLSLQEYLEREKYVTAHVAVERNGHIVPRADFSRTMLGDEDCLEIVAFVGGG